MVKFCRIDRNLAQHWFNRLYRVSNFGVDAGVKPQTYKLITSSKTIVQTYIVDCLMTAPNRLISVFCHMESTAPNSMESGTPWASLPLGERVGVLVHLGEGRTLERVSPPLDEAPHSLQRPRRGSRHAHLQAREIYTRPHDCAHSSKILVGWNNKLV